MIDPAWVSGLSAILFIIGLIGVFTRKNAIIVLMCIELMLNAATTVMQPVGFTPSSQLQSPLVRSLSD